MRLRNKPWAMDFINEYPEIIEKKPSSWKGRWKERFANEHPLFVEVGTGKGQFVTEMANAFPNINFIGIEKYESVIVTGVQRVLDSPKNNLVFLQEDVNNITEFFSEKEVDRVYINFTDPWPKIRHAKRRLTHQDFLKKYDNILKNKGEIHLKTDNRGLFEYSIESFSAYGYQLKNISLDLHNSDMNDNIMTEFEERFSKEGINIYRLEAWINR